MYFGLKLPFEQRVALLTLANQLINIDGIRDKSEDDYFNLLRKSLHIDEDVPLSSSTRSELLKIFTNRRAKVTLLLELLSMSLIDKVYDIGENDLIEEIATLLGFTNVEISRLKELVINYRKAINQIEDFISIKSH